MDGPTESPLPQLYGYIVWDGNVDSTHSRLDAYHHGVLRASTVDDAYYRMLQHLDGHLHGRYLYRVVRLREPEGGVGALEEDEGAELRGGALVADDRNGVRPFARVQVIRDPTVPLPGRIGEWAKDVDDLAYSYGRIPESWSVFVGGALEEAGFGYEENEAAVLFADHLSQRYGKSLIVGVTELYEETEFPY